MNTIHHQPQRNNYGGDQIKPRLLTTWLSILATTILLASCARGTPPPATTQSTSASAEKLVPAAQAFVEQMAKGDFAAATSSFDSAMKSAAPEATLKGIWGQLIAKMGAYQKQVGSHTGEVQGYQVVFITTQFEQGTIDIRVVFDKQGKISGMQFVPAGSSSATPQPYNPPAYVNTASFHEVDVTVGSGEWALPGTLALPNGNGPFRAVVLVHGSGPNDRDETIGPNKPFRDLAWGLASQGIAVLRYDKRTLVYGSKFTPEQIAKLTVKEETTDDALAAVQLLRQRQDIDPQHVYVLGHSLGAMMAPRIGQQDPSLAGLIIMAGPTRPLEDVILDQVQYLDGLKGTPTPQQQKDLEDLKAAVARVKDPSLSDQVPSKDLPLGISAAYWLDLRGYQPAEVAKTLAMPVLVAQGGRDYQVSPTKDFPGWESALAGKANATLKLYPSLNHLFISGDGASTPDEYTVAGHVSQELVDDLSRWLKQ